VYRYSVEVHCAGTVYWYTVAGMYNAQQCTGTVHTGVLYYLVQVQYGTGACVFQLTSTILICTA